MKRPAEPISAEKSPAMNHEPISPASLPLPPPKCGPGGGGGVGVFPPSSRPLPPQSPSLSTAEKTPVPRKHVMAESIGRSQTGHPLHTPYCQPDCFNLRRAPMR